MPKTKNEETGSLSKYELAKLKKLYKRKGDKSKLSSFRFVHLKDWAAKIMEKLVMKKCEEKINGAMPEMQIGGRAKSTTIEHIMSLYTLARIKCRQGKGVIFQFVDCMKCFDKESTGFCLKYTKYAISYPF